MYVQRDTLLQYVRREGEYLFGLNLAKQPDTLTLYIEFRTPHYVYKNKSQYLEHGFIILTPKSSSPKRKPCPNTITFGRDEYSIQVYITIPNPRYGFVFGLLLRRVSNRRTRLQNIRIQATAE